MDDNFDYITRREIQREIIKIKEADRLQEMIDNAIAYKMAGMHTKEGNRNLRKWIADIERRIRKLRGYTEKKDNTKITLEVLQGLKFLR